MNVHCQSTGVHVRYSYLIPMGCYPTWVHWSEREDRVVVTISEGVGLVKEGEEGGVPGETKVKISFCEGVTHVMWYTDNFETSSYEIWFCQSTRSSLEEVWQHQCYHSIPLQTATLKLSLCSSTFKVDYFWWIEVHQLTSNLAPGQLFASWAYLYCAYFVFNFELALWEVCHVNS